MTAAPRGLIDAKPNAGRGQDDGASDRVGCDLIGTRTGGLAGRAARPCHEQADAADVEQRVTYPGDPGCSSALASKARQKRFQSSDFVQRLNSR
jgi:hypothetical protein